MHMPSVSLGVASRVGRARREPAGVVHKSERRRAGGRLAIRGAARGRLWQPLTAVIPEAGPRHTVRPDRDAHVVEAEVVARAGAAGIQRSLGGIVDGGAPEQRPRGERVGRLGDVAVESLTVAALAQVGERYVPWRA